VRERILREIGYYIICPYCKRSVVSKNYKVIKSLLHFSKCEDCQHFERLPEPRDVVWDHQKVEVVAVCNDEYCYATFFTEEQLARDNESIVNDLGCTYSKEKRVFRYVAFPATIPLACLAHLLSPPYHSVMEKTTTHLSTPKRERGVLGPFNPFLGTKGSSSKCSILSQYSCS